MSNLFRREAVENFSSRTSNTTSVRAISVKTSVFVFIITLCSAIFVCWFLFGTILETVSVDGIVWPSSSTVDIYVRKGGILTKKLVNEGTYVRNGDILALIPQMDILSEIAEKKENGVSEEELEALYSRYETLSVIRAKNDGIVTYIGNENSYISDGQRVASVAPYSEGGNNRTITAFLPSDKSALVSVGLEVQVMPDFAPREQYGYIGAYVSAIDPYPIRGDSIKTNNGEVFVPSIDENKSYIRLEITLMPDAQAESNLKWSNPASSSVNVVMGTQCSADIILRKCRPYKWFAREDDV